MAETALKRAYVEAMVKHLPPSASQLRLLDVNGEAGEVLSDLRDDLHIVTVPGLVDHWQVDITDKSIDAVVALDYHLNARFLEKSLTTLRPGGRLIVVNRRGQITEALGKRLEQTGYVRILVEAAIDAPMPEGVLMRGERPHTTADTHARIQQIATSDADMLDMTTYKGRYVHVLIREQPNIPIWRRQGDEPITWQAVALKQNGTETLLAFSSLPRAVGFMQPAVLTGKINDVNKVGKFSRVTASTWTLPVILNPTMAVLDKAQVTLVDIDPETAEAPDE